VHLVDAAAHGGFRLCQMDAGVGADGLLQVVQQHRLDRQPVLHRQLDRVRQVVLALFREPDARQGIPQPVRTEAVGANVQLLDLLLLLGGGALLDDGIHRSRRVAHDAAEAARILRDDGQQAERAGVVLLRLHEAGQRLGAQQGHVAVADKHQVRAAAEQRLRLHDRVGRAKLRLLDGGLCRPVEELDDLLRPVPDHDNGLPAGGGADGLQHVPDHGFAGEGMEHLRQAGFHASALPGREQDCGYFHGPTPMKGGRLIRRGWYSRSRHCVQCGMFRKKKTGLRPRPA
jgi:hypothetical protein